MEYSGWAILTIIVFIGAALAYTSVVFRLFPNAATINVIDCVIIGAALSFGMIAFLGFPPDITESSIISETNKPSSSFATGSMVGVWKFLYFGWLVVNWGIIFMYKQILKSGHWNFWGRLGHGMMRTLVIYLVIGIPAIIVVVVLVATKKFTAAFLYSLLISLVNTFGTFQIVLLLAYGIIDVPRRLIITAFPTLRLYQIYYDAYKTAANVRKLYKDILAQRAKQELGLSVIPRRNYMSIYSQRLVGLQLVPQKELEAMAKAYATKGTAADDDLKVTGLWPTLYNSSSTGADSQYKSKTGLVSQQKVSNASVVHIEGNPYNPSAQGSAYTNLSTDRGQSAAELPPRSSYPASGRDSKRSQDRSAEPTDGPSRQGSAQSSRSSKDIGKSHHTRSASFTEESIEMSTGRVASASAGDDIHTEAILRKRHSASAFKSNPASVYETATIQIAGRLVRFPKSPTIVDMPVCSCKCHGGERRTITTPVKRGLKLVEKANFKLKFLYWNAMREHGAMENLVAKRNYYEMLVQIKQKGSTLEKLKSRPNLNPHWEKIFSRKRLGPMTFGYLKYFRCFLLMLIAIFFSFFSAVLVLSEFMSPIAKLAGHSPLLLLYDHVEKTQSRSAALILVYCIFALIVTYLQCALLNLRFFNVYRLTFKSTDIMSLLFIIARVPTYIFPLGWNLMLLLDIQISTAYGSVLSKMTAIEISGQDFSNYFPIAIIALVVAFASNLDRIIWAAMGQDITPNVICLLRNNPKVAAGELALSQWVNGEFVYVEAQEPSSKKKQNCCTKCCRSIFAPADEES